jgi:hypothetical protein
MNVVQQLVLRAAVFGTASSRDGAHPCLPWLVRKGYITEACWDAEVTQDGYVAGIASGALTPWFALSDALTLEVNTYGAGSFAAPRERLVPFLAAMRRGLAEGSLKLVAETSNYYKVVAR